MCFSATASFAASGLLLLISCVTMARARIKQQYIMLASIPLLFAIQQASEGMVWHALQSNQSATLYSYIFLFFAMIVWPTWIPLSLHMIEPDKTKKNLSIPLYAGIAVSITAIILAFFNVEPITMIEQCHIYYSFDLPLWLVIPFGLTYLVATIVPFFLSSIRHMKIMGSVMAFSYAISYMFYHQFLISVWCFFAALLSILIVITLK